MQVGDYKNGDRVIWFKRGDNSSSMNYQKVPAIVMAHGSYHRVKVKAEIRGIEVMRFVRPENLEMFDVDLQQIKQ